MDEFIDRGMTEDTETNKMADAGFHLAEYADSDRHAQQTGQTQNCLTRYLT